MSSSAYGKQYRLLIVIVRLRKTIMFSRVNKMLYRKKLLTSSIQREEWKRENVRSFKIKSSEIDMI